MATSSTGRSSARKATSMRDAIGTRTPLRRFLNRLVGDIVIVVTIVSAIYLAVFSFDQRDKASEDRRIIACQSTYIAIIATSLSERGALNDEDRNNLRLLVLGVTRSTSGEESRAALNKYLTEYERITKERTLSPLPKPPDCVREATGARGG
jgi:hypothetical protein